ncbi:MAG TPA: hypothetical protein VFV34_04160 [Blastocatellia bacterium]|nr:hypothetical protein [Blastocatellia bacterium]
MRLRELLLIGAVVGSCAGIRARTELYANEIARPIPSETQQRRIEPSVPRLAIEQKRHDFGKAFAGEALSHVFGVRNAGTAPLTLSDKTAAPHVGSLLPGDRLAPRVAGFPSSRRVAAAAPQ